MSIYVTSIIPIKNEKYLNKEEKEDRKEKKLFIIQFGNVCSGYWVSISPNKVGFKNLITSKDGISN